MCLYNSTNATYMKKWIIVQEVQKLSTFSHDSTRCTVLVVPEGAIQRQETWYMSKNLRLFWSCSQTLGRAAKIFSLLLQWNERCIHVSVRIDSQVVRMNNIRRWCLQTSISATLLRSFTPPIPWLHELQPILVHADFKSLKKAVRYFIVSSEFSSMIHRWHRDTVRRVFLFTPSAPSLSKF